MSHVQIIQDLCIWHKIQVLTMFLKALYYVIPDHISDLIFYYSFPISLHCTYVDLCVVPQKQQTHPLAEDCICCSCSTESSSPTYFSWLVASSLWSDIHQKWLSWFYMHTHHHNSLLPGLAFLIPHSMDHYLTYLFVHSFVVFISPLECKLRKSSDFVLLTAVSSPPRRNTT